MLVGNSVYNSTGSYTDTIQSSIGCDSIVNTFLTVNPNIIFNQFFLICEGEVISVGNSTLWLKNGLLTSLKNIFSSGMYI